MTSMLRVDASSAKLLNHGKVRPWVLRFAVALACAHLISGHAWRLGTGFISGGLFTRRSPRTGRSAGGVMQSTSVELELAVQQGKPVVVDFYATWCGPCQMLTPELVKVAGKMADRVTILKVDTDVETEIASELHIEALPTLLFFKDGNMKPVAKVEGMVTSDWLEDFIEKNLLSEGVSF
eukprot:Skav202988  [mRNA]  locus=scaffold2267:336736:352515:- [translate_table: standard]